MRAKLTLLVALAAVAALWAAPASAFHDEGVAHCNRCHTMHNSQDGALVDPDSPDGNPWLLVDATPSDVCLPCHDDSSYRGVFNGDCATGTVNEENGGGNYIFLTCANISESSRSSIPGDAAGHNLDAPGHGLATDATLVSAPGGDFPSVVMGCTSCHDPHGNANFRLLYGPRLVQGFYPFSNPAPNATGKGKGLPDYRDRRGAPETPTNHTAYNGGMALWCANCHADFENISDTHKHPVGVAIGSDIALSYNLYNGSHDLFGGSQATAYLPQVPFEDTDATTYNNTSSMGPRAASQVSCITCHRAHATSAADSGRWDFNVTFLEEDGRTSAPLPNPYPAPTGQRSLCNKCHVQDVDDALIPDGDI